MKITKKIIRLMLITFMTSASLLSCKFETNIINNTITENNSIVAEKGLLVPDAIDLIENYYGREIPLLKIIVFNQKDVDALANAIKNKQSTFVSIDLSSSDINQITGFSGCQNLRRIILPNRVEIIGECAFKDCTYLTNVKMPFYLKEIKDEAFYNCPMLKSIEISDLLKTIGRNIISNNDALEFKFNINEANNSWGVKSLNKAISLNYTNYIAYKDEMWSRF